MDSMDASASDESTVEYRILRDADGFGMQGRVRVAVHASVDMAHVANFSTSSGRKQHHWRRTPPWHRNFTSRCVAIDVDSAWCG